MQRGAICGCQVFFPGKDEIAHFTHAQRNASSAACRPYLNEIVIDVGRVKVAVAAALENRQAPMGLACCKFSCCLYQSRHPAPVDVYKFMWISTASHANPIWHGLPARGSARLVQTSRASFAVFWMSDLLWHHIQTLCILTSVFFFFPSEGGGSSTPWNPHMCVAYIITMVTSNALQVHYYGNFSVLCWQIWLDYDPRLIKS